MTSHGAGLRTISGRVGALSLATTKLKQVLMLTTMLFAALACFAQQPQRASSATDAQNNAQAPVSGNVTAEQAAPKNAPPETASLENTSVTILTGTRFALVLTHSIQTRYIHRGDDIYAQIVSPITSGNEVIIPAGTFVQGKVDKLARVGGRGEMHLQSMEVIFPDGYVVPISGAVTLETDDGYALKDPGRGRLIGAFALPAGWCWPWRTNWPLGSQFARHHHHQHSSARLYRTAAGMPFVKCDGTS